MPELRKLTVTQVAAVALAMLAGKKLNAKEMKEALLEVKANLEAAVHKGLLLNGAEQAQAVVKATPKFSR